MTTSRSRRSLLAILAAAYATRAEARSPARPASMCERGEPVIEIRPLRLKDAGRAAAIHRRAGALIPGYVTLERSLESFEALYRDEVVAHCAVWGAFASTELLGFVALLPGWIDHLYVDPDHHRRGIGGALVRLAQSEQEELRLHTFQANANARRLYERHGFVVEELTDGERNEERMLDVTYQWTRPEPPATAVCP